MNKNEQKRNIKIQIVQEAIRYLRDQQVPFSKISKKYISATLEQKYAHDKDKQISVNTLSKPFYKKNFDTWVNEIYGIEKNDKRVQRSKEVKSKNLEVKLKRIEKYGDELIEKIARGKVKCPKFTKRFLRDWIVSNKDEDLSESIFSSTTKGYQEIYERLEAKLKAPVDMDSDLNSKELVNVNEVAKLKQELQLYKKTLDNLITQQFVVLDSVEKPLVEGDGNEFKGVSLDRETLYAYLLFMKDKFDNEINAYQLFKSLTQECAIKKNETMI
ncbi:hypothetical protein [Priestia endophytica]|uniref:hypothetical protein n=1 Tax=Priestia endophytica TaxID=135735 RepID=UPI000DCA5DE7|nr:hypothetical protein [Priestia endophytica]RAS83082.1 hypothetical protein A4R27_08025 [Priestia endophytica]